MIMNLLFLCGLGVFAGAAMLQTVFAQKASPAARRFSLWAMLCASLLFLGFSLNIVLRDSVFILHLYQLTDGLKFSFYVDRLAAFFMMIISGISAAACFYSLGYIEHHGTEAGKNLLVAMMSLFIVSMLLLVAADNTFCLLFFWEIMAVTSFLMVMFDRDKPEVRKSGMFYFAMTQLSTTFLMFGFIALYHATGSFEIAPALGMSALMKAVIFLSLFIGFAIKAGVMPFHKWLPYAYSASPSNITSLMSGAMAKVAIYGLVRYLVFVLTPDRWWGVLILLFGTFSALLGIIYALKEHDIKKLLAYSSIENVGIILIGIGLYLIFRSYGLNTIATLALVGALFHSLNHALFKAILFMTTGSVENATGTRDIEKMGGLIKVMPYTGALFLIGSVALAALPPFNGFVSELMIFQAFLQSFIIGNPFLKILLFLGLSLFALTSALAAACFVKAFGLIFLATPRSEEAQTAKEASPTMIIGPAILAGVCLLLGIFSYQIFSWLGFNFHIPNMMTIGLALLITFAVIWLFLRLFSNRATRTSETWGCGVPVQTAKMEYTATGFSEPILRIFRPIYRTREKVDRNFSDAGASVFKDGSAEIITFKLFEEKIYVPIANFIIRLSDIISNLHDVDLDTYILYSFIAIVILIIAAGLLI